MASEPNHDSEAILFLRPEMKRFAPLVTPIRTRKLYSGLVRGEICAYALEVGFCASVRQRIPEEGL